MSMTRTAFNIQHQDHFVHPESWLSLLRDVTSATSSSGSIYVIDAPSGAGKTVFSQMLVSEIDASNRTGVVELAENISTIAVFESLLRHLGLPVSSSQSIGQSIMTLRQYTMMLAKQAQHKVLVIDNAHYLEEQALAALASIFQGLSSEEPGFALVLLAEPGLAHQLDALNLIDVEVRDAPLPSLTALEVGELLQADFAKIPSAYGVSDHAYQALPLNQELVDEIWRDAQGRPNDALSAARLAAHDLREAGSPWWKNIPLIHILALIALVLTLLWVYWTHGVKKEKEPEELTHIENAQVMSSKGVSLKGDSAKDTSLEPASLNKVPNEALPDAQVKTNLTSLENAVSSVTETNTNNDLPATKNLPTGKAQPADVPTVVKDSVESTLSQTPSKLAAKKTSSPKATSKPQPKQSDTASKVAKKPIVPPKRSRADLNDLSDHEQALMLMPPRGYVLQVLASSSHATLKSFWDKQPNRHSLRIYRSIRSGKSWFVLVEGYYADKQSASAAIRNLPSVQLRSGPWPKSLNAVRLEITAFKQQP